VRATPVAAGTEALGENIVHKTISTAALPRLRLISCRGGRLVMHELEAHSRGTPEPPAASIRRRPPAAITTYTQSIPRPACSRGREGKHTRGGRVFLIIRICIVFCIVFVFLAPATRDRCGGRKRDDDASCLGCTLGTWLCSMSNSIIYHVSCYCFVSQHTYIYHIGPHAHVDTDSDSRQKQQPPAPAPAVAQIIQNNTKFSLL
jgi:hypothetical protein